MRLSTLICLTAAVWIFGSVARAAEAWKVWPVDAKPALTSSFCEFRPGHFHSGVDIKVWGVLGSPCRAVGDGWVSRVKTSPGGYGRALYLTLTDGRTAVYAHLDRFPDQVEAQLAPIQESSGIYAQDVFFEPDDAVQYQQGDVVGYAGRSGVKFAHLHFEIRDPAQRPLNPILEGLPLADHIAPVPAALAVIPLDANSTVERDCQPRIYSHLTRLNDGLWTPGDPIGVSGRVGIAVDAYDKADAADNLMAVCGLALFRSGGKCWVTDFDRFDFDETRRMDLERDYRLLRRGDGIFHRLYSLPGREFPMSEGDGSILLGSDTSVVDLVVVLSDAAGNETRLAFQLVSDRLPPDDRGLGGKPLVNPIAWEAPGHSPVRITLFDDYIRLAAAPGVLGFHLDSYLNLSLPAWEVEGGVAASWSPRVGHYDGEPFVLSIIGSDEVAFEQVEFRLYPVTPQSGAIVECVDYPLRLVIPPGAVYDTMWVQIIPDSSFEVPGRVISAYRVEPRDIPLAGEVSIQLGAKGGDLLAEGFGVYYYDEKKGWLFLGCDSVGDYLAGPALSWEVFGLVRDIDKPQVVFVSPKTNGAATGSRPRIEVSVRDATSGLSDSGLVMKIDGRRVPAEFDPPRYRLLYTPWQPLIPGKHLIEVSATDRVGNRTDLLLVINVQGK